MMEAVYTSETLVNLYQSTWCYSPKDSHLHTHGHKNLKSFKEVSYIYCSDFLPRLEDDEIFTPKISFSYKATFHYNEILTDITSELGEETILMILRNIRESVKINVFCACPKKNVFRLFFFLA
jgi:hypothetical protein